MANQFFFPQDIHCEACGGRHNGLLPFTVLVDERGAIHESHFECPMTGLTHVEEPTTSFTAPTPWSPELDED
jgi:hypothetical protein